MRTKRALGYGLILLVAVASLGLPDSSRAAPPGIDKAQYLPPVRISDDTFSPEDWTVAAEATGGASYTVNQQLTGGFGGGPFRFMSHRLPPVSGSGLTTIAVTHVYLGASYDPGVQGAILAIDYRESGIILSFPFPEAFSTTQPVVVQGGRTYRSSKFLRFIAQNSSHYWEIKTLLQLTAADFVAVDGSGDHPDFSAGGGPIQFGFTRSNSRSSTLPPVPGDQDMVIDQGVDTWLILVYREDLPPQAVDDVFILDGYQRSLPFFEIFDVVRNDSDPNQDHLEVIEVTEPLYGSAGSLSDHTIVYQLDEARTYDTFNYTISDGALTSSAQVEVYVDCACVVLCLNDLQLPASPSPSFQATDNIDLPLIYRVRDRVLQSTPDGRRYVDMYYTNNPEILVNIMTNEPLRAEAVAAVELWQENLRSLVDGDGSAVVTQAQIDALESFLNNLSAVSSAGLQQVIAAELQRLGPLDDYAGLTIREATRRMIGDPKVYLPLIRR